MDGSLASIFMDPPSALLNGQVAEGLRHKLMQAALDLENAKTSLEAEGKLQQSQLWNLQELLDRTRKERDEAVEECRKLKQYLSMQNQDAPVPQSAFFSPCRLVQADPVTSSSHFDPWAFSSLKQWNLTDPVMEPLQSFTKKCGEAQNMQTIFPVVEEQLWASDKFSLNVLGLDLEQGPGLDLTEMHEQDAFFQFNVSPSPKSQVLHCLSRQSSSNSSAVSEQRDVGESSEPHAITSTYILDPNAISAMVVPEPVPKEAARIMAINAGQSRDTVMDPNGYVAGRFNNSSIDAVSEHGFTSMPVNQVSDGHIAPVSDDCSSEAAMYTNGSTIIMPSHIYSSEAVPTMITGVGSQITSNCPVSESMVNVDFAEMMASAPFMPSVPTNTIQCSLPSDVMPATVAASVSCAPRHGMYPSSALRAVSSPCKAFAKVHLPEPPEADPQVMLSSLPERGKLLQAVMQAGPLLQTLLLAGPLPQWRHPPPALSSGDIPKVFTTSTNANTEKPHLSTAPQVASCPWACYSPESSVSRMNKRVINADSCSRCRKLHRISALGNYGEQERMALVARSASPSIY